MSTFELEKLGSPFKEMLENYLLAREQYPVGFSSMHWDVFPDDYEKTISSTSDWNSFLRNAISIGFNDEMMKLGNQRWHEASDENQIDVWSMRKEHDYRDLMEGIENKDALIKSFRLVCAVCSIKFVLESLGSDTGSPLIGTLSVKLTEPSFDIATGKSEQKTKEHFVSCNGFDLGTIYYFWQISRVMDELTTTDRPLVAEIGPGYGLLMSKIKKRYPRSRCVLFDLPEMSAVQLYYLSCEFPEAKILHYKDLTECKLSFIELDFDFLILPGWMIESMPENYVDVFINMRSMMEMNKNTIKYYFDHIHRTMKDHGIFACFNRYEKNTADQPSVLKFYPYDDYWSIVISQASIFQGHIHDLILKRQAEKNKLPVSQTLKSLPPFNI